jgi:hypothetical protein
MLSVTVGLEAVPIGWQRFILGSSQSDCTAFLLFLVTKATRLLAQALSLLAGLACYAMSRTRTGPSVHTRTSKRNRVVAIGVDRR